MPWEPPALSSRVIAKNGWHWSLTFRQLGSLFSPWRLVPLWSLLPAISPPCGSCWRKQTWPFTSPSSENSFRCLVAGLAPSLPAPEAPGFSRAFLQTTAGCGRLDSVLIQMPKQNSPSTTHTAFPVPLLVWLQGPTWGKVTLQMPQHSGDCSLTHHSWGFQAVKWILYYLMKGKKIKLTK